uniref:Putative trypsin-like serine protease n=1 Tax=Corethrella appendiculata TaxID=1370023 RepID=U5EQH8_9DIPT
MLRKDFLLIIFSIISAFSLVFAQDLSSPCPKIFQYQYDSNRNEYVGIIALKTFQVGQTAKLYVRLSVGTRLPSEDVGSLEVIGTKQSVFNDIVDGRPVNYRVVFPVQNPLPKLTLITLNGVTACSGPPAQANYITTIQLDHVLMATLNNGDGSNVNNNNFNNVGNFNPTNNDNDLNGWTNYNLQTQRPVTQRPAPPSPATQRPVTQQPTFRPQTQRPKPTPTPQQTISSSNVICGQPIAGVSPLIYQGKPTTHGQFPWIAAIFAVVNSGASEFICGGSIISQDVILTAAHCLYRSQSNKRLTKEQVTVSLGRYNINNWGEKDIQNSQVDQLITHPDYNNLKPTDADIGILKLYDYIEYTRFIRPACLWNGDTSLNNIVGVDATVVGWGEQEDGSRSQTPQVATVPIVEQDTCLRQSPEFRDITSKRTFCAGGEGKGPCRGDSGGGLLIKQNSQWYIRGIVSKATLEANTNKCDLTKYVVYTDVTKYREWLLEYME